LEKLGEMNVKEVECDGVDQGWVLVNMVITFGFIEGREFLDKWSNS
jgi:hypothetical protein